MVAGGSGSGTMYRHFYIRRTRRAKYKNEDPKYNEEELFLFSIYQHNIMHCALLCSPLNKNKCSSSSSSSRVVVALVVVVVC